MTAFARQWHLLVPAALVVAPQYPAVAKPTPPDRFELGANSAGDSCSASRQWTMGEGGIRLSGAQPFAITCRGVSAAEAQGYLSAPREHPSIDQCGAPAAASVSGIGPVEVRRCFDAQLGRPVVDIRFERKGASYQGAALEVALGPLESALKVVAASSAPPSGRKTVAPSIKLDSVPPGPVVTTVAQGSGITAEAALTEGVSGLQAGRMLDASRVLNDALRAFADADAGTKLDLRLAAGLADSNLSRFSDAEEHFAVAQLILANSPNLPDGPYKQQQLITYRGIDRINQHRWADAIEMLSRGGSGVRDLQDPTTLSRLNQEAAVQAGSLQSSLTDANALSRNLLEAQRNWALSVAYLALGRTADAERALATAAEAARDPVREIAPERIVWMRSSIERQKARIEARKGDFGTALASFDCAISALQGSAPQEPGTCVFVERRPLPDTALNAPLLVEAQLERASTESRDPARQQVALADYSSAVQSLSNLTGTGYVSQAALERYFSLLTQAPESDSRDEEYFRAMQMISEPASARELAQLRQSAASDPKVADLLRQRVGLERQLIRLRYEITAATGAAQADLPGLEAERAAADAKLAEVNAALLGARGIGALEDQPATIATIRSALAPGEVFWKLVALRSSMFGIAIGRDRTLVYQATERLPRIDNQAVTVLTSAQTDESGSTRLFAVAPSHQLFEAIAGPAASMVAGAKRIIYNPAGELRRLPPAILVTDPASVEAYQKQVAKGDFSKVAFLGRNVESMVALSPRSFLQARARQASLAPKPFLGLGENSPPAPVSDAVASKAMPFDCTVSYGAWAANMMSARPISAREISVAADALGIGSPPEIVGPSFTDANLLSGPASQELSQYQILHFATHGLPEQRSQVDQCSMTIPPALLTTLAPPAPDGKIMSDGLLSFSEVADLRLDANLVVLSACDTSSGAVATGRRSGIEESSPALDGLVRSFLVADARSVLATFWSVPATRQSDDLMAAFYRAGRTSSMSAALKSAQNTLMQQPRYSNPYYWGAYFLVGDGAKMMLSGPRTASTSSGDPRLK
ncbi:CHAT domain-containing protein [Sphingomonas sp. MAH-20]|uniref:CHAT domain-containing protein n=1 Tax=Sphingomonas horti TaxID=2682842 RepID=A0A6I4IX88_9SPHN|nr:MULTISPECIES: CHAT domain-containing protein [Sphingomonas]MBA2920558.1 CHAT domain-containing protein [Sphingomonas sp. CGMCC 1.13658]MVO76810.1 CHAT domain-containing protein [Sphingomonas horti]